MSTPLNLIEKYSQMDNLELLISKEDIQNKIIELGKQIAEDYKGK